MKLVDIISSGEQRGPQIQLHGHTGQGKHIDSRCVLLSSQQILRRTVPSGSHIISRYFMRGYGQSEIDELDLGRGLVDEYVLRLDVTVDYAALVDVGQSQGGLEEDAFDLLLSQTIALLLVEFEGVLRQVLQGHAGLS